MITLYAPSTGRPVSGGPELVVAGGPGAPWIDLLEPSPAEEAAIKSVLGIDIPTREEMQEIEASSRLARDGDALVMTAPVLVDSAGSNPRNSAVTFILTRERLITVRTATPGGIATYLARLERMPSANRPVSGGQVLLDLLEAVVDRMADVLERVAGELDSVSHRIFHQPAQRPIGERPRRRSTTRDLEATLRTIGRSGDITSKVRDTLLGLRRMVSYLPAADAALGVADARGRLKTVGRDIQSLNEYSEFLESKIGFLVNSTLGMISIQQNHIIKLFSVVAVLFLPPTLVASIYGMNFAFMPELDQPWGYPLALVLMIGAALLPYWIFKRRNWL